MLFDLRLKKGSITLTSQLSPVKPSLHEHVYPSITSDEGKHVPCPEQMFVCPHAFFTYNLKLKVKKLTNVLIDNFDDFENNWKLKSKLMF